MEHIYHIAVFEEVSKELNQIINIETSVVRDLIGLRHNSIGINNLSAQIVEKLFSQGQKAYFKKDCQSVELMPQDIFSGADVTDLNVLRNQKLSDAKYQISHSQALVTGLMMFDFICINNELIDKGYVITDYNREDKYIEILEADDEDLVDKLERYLNARDAITRASFLEQEYQKFYTDIKQSQTEEDILKVSDEFNLRLRNVQK